MGFAHQTPEDARFAYVKQSIIKVDPQGDEIPRKLILGGFRILEIIERDGDRILRRQNESSGPGEGIDVFRIPVKVDVGIHSQPGKNLELDVPLQGI